MMRVPMGTLCVLFLLLQCVLADPRPDFTFAVSFPSTNRVTVGIGNANTVVTSIKTSAMGATMVSSLTMLSDVLKIVQDVAREFQTLAESIISTVNTLATDTSGDVANVFGAALTAVNNAIAFGDTRLPELTAPLQLLIGNPLSDKFDDSIQHIGKALEALNVSLTSLSDAATSATAEANGEVPIPQTIVRKYMSSTLISTLTSAMRLLKGTVPVLTYTVQSTVDGLNIADAYMGTLDTAVDTTIGGSSALASSLDEIVTSYNTSIDGKLNTITTDLTQLVTDVSGLTKVAATVSATNLNTALGGFSSFLDQLAAKQPTVQQVLSSLSDSLLSAYAIVDPLYNIYQSPLVDALITTLVANGNYAQYCFYKYELFLFEMLENIAIGIKECTDEEVRKLQYFLPTVELLLSLFFYDFEDITNDMRTCDGISDAANLQECIAKFATIYSALKDSFGHKFNLFYNILHHEMIATGDRLKICIRMSQSALRDTDIPLLIQNINSCGELGPLAE